MTDANRLDNARAEAAVGDDALRAAELLATAGLANDAISRAYYAAFHLARALLLTEGLEPKTHGGTLALLHKHFGARLSSDALARLARLQTFRGLADYDARERLPPHRATEEIAAATAFIAEARALLVSAGV